MKYRDRHEMIRMAGMRYSNLPQKKGLQRPSRPPEQAILSSERGRRGSSRRAVGAAEGKRKVVAATGTAATANRRVAAAAAVVAVTAAVEAAKTPVVAVVTTAAAQPLLARPPGHSQEDCTTKPSDFAFKCATCDCFEHGEGTCTSARRCWCLSCRFPKKTLPWMLKDAQAFTASEAGKCSAMIGDEVGSEALDKQVVQFIAGSAATCNLTLDADGLNKYRECSQPLSLANGGLISIVVVVAAHICSPRSSRP